LKGDRGFADTGQHPALSVFLESVCLFLVAGETVLFENALREAAVAVNIH